MSRKILPLGKSLVGFGLWSATFGCLWWIITNGAEDSWIIGVPVIAAASLWRTLASDRLPIPNLLGLLRFAPYFVWHSLKGGTDVAWRALRPGCRLAPITLDIPLRLPPGAPRLLFVNVVGLLPGTLGIEMGERRLQVHVLNRQGGFAQELQTLETRTAALFGLTLPAIDLQRSTR